MIDQALMYIFRYSSLGLNRGHVVLEVAPTRELRRGETQIKTPSETLVDEMCMQGGHKTSSDSPVHDRNEDIIC